MMNPTQSNSQQ